MEDITNCTNKDFEYRDDCIVISMFMSVVLLGECAITLYVCRRNLKLREKVSSKMLKSLAISEGLIGILLLCYALIKLANPILHIDTNCNVFRLRFLLVEIIPRVLHITFVLMLCCLSLDRYLALCWPLRYRDLLTPSLSQWLVRGCWIGVFLIFIIIPCTTVKLISRSPSRIPFMTVYVIVFTLAILFMMTLFILMAREFRQSNHQIMEVSKAMREENSLVRRKTAVDVIFVVFLNLVFSIPDITLQCVLLMTMKNEKTIKHETTNETTIKYETTIYESFRHIPPLLLLLHQCTFLPIYAWRNAVFRQALLQFWASFKPSCSSRHQHHQQPSISTKTNSKLTGFEIPATIFKASTTLQLPPHSLKTSSLKTLRTSNTEYLPHNSMKTSSLNTLKTFNSTHISTDSLKTFSLTFTKPDSDLPPSSALNASSLRVCSTSNSIPHPPTSHKTTSLALFKSSNNPPPPLTSLKTSSLTTLMTPTNDHQPPDSHNPSSLKAFNTSSRNHHPLALRKTISLTTLSISTTQYPPTSL